MIRLSKLITEATVDSTEILTVGGKKSDLKKTNLKKYIGNWKFIPNGGNDGSTPMITPRSRSRYDTDEGDGTVIAINTDSKNSLKFNIVWSVDEYDIYGEKPIDLSKVKDKQSQIDKLMKFVSTILGDLIDELDSYLDYDDDY